MNELELTTREPQVVERQTEPLTIERAYEAVMHSDLTADKLAVMERLLKMDAERQFAASLAKLQSELPIIEATSVIPNRGKYARFEHIMQKIQGPLATNGFSVSFRQSIADGRIVETCTIKHRAGHFTETPFAVRPGGKADSETQADCKASTTAKRNALCNALNIVITQDCLMDGSDAANEGAFISPAEALELKRRVFQTGSDVIGFLKFGGVSIPEKSTADEIDKAFQRIATAKYAVLDAALCRKEKT